MPSATISATDHVVTAAAPPSSFHHRGAAPLGGNSQLDTHTHEDVNKTLVAAPTDQ